MQKDKYFMEPNQSIENKSVQSTPDPIWSPTNSGHDQDSLQVKPKQMELQGPGNEERLQELLVKKLQNQNF